jgi:hypothetical protein
MDGWVGDGSNTRPYPHPNFTNFSVFKNYFEFANKEGIE